MKWLAFVLVGVCMSMLVEAEELRFTIPENASINNYISSGGAGQWLFQNENYSGNMVAFFNWIEATFCTEIDFIFLIKK